MGPLLVRELRLAVSEGGSSARALIFFAVILGVVPLAVGPAPDVLSRLGGGMIWIMALLSTLLSLDRLFQADLEDGSLVSLMTTPGDAAGPPSLWQIVCAKSVAHWGVTCLPVVVAAPFLGLWYDLPVGALWAAGVSLLVGTPALVCIGAIGAALLAGVRRGGVLVTVIIMPLYVPILIFGASAVEAAASQAIAGPLIQILAGISIISMVLGPIATTAALKVHID